MTCIFAKVLMGSCRFFYSVVALYRRLLIKTFEGEENLNCFVLAARTLLSLKQSESFQELGLEFSYAEYWNRLLEQFENSRSQSVTEVVLPLLGSLLSKVKESYGLQKSGGGRYLPLMVIRSWSKRISIANGSSAALLYGAVMLWITLTRKL